MKFEQFLNEKWDENLGNYHGDLSKLQSPEKVKEMRDALRKMLSAPHVSKTIENITIHSDGRTVSFNLSRDISDLDSKLLAQLSKIRGGSLKVLAHSQLAWVQRF